jgi:hypothetical protein
LNSSRTRIAVRISCDDGMGFFLKRWEGALQVPPIE